MTIRVFASAIIGVVLLTLLAKPAGVEAKTTSPTFDMIGFWWLDDDASGLNVEDNTGFGAGNTAQETHITDLQKNSNVRLRIEIEETANQTLDTNIQPRLEYSTGDNSCTAGVTWTTITTSSTNAFQLVDSSTITDGDGVGTNLITGGVKGFIVDLGELRDATNPATSVILDNAQAEWEWNFIATSNASDSQIYTFRVVDALGTALVYNLPTADDCPNATTAAAATTTFTQNDFEWFIDEASVTLTDPWPAGGLNLAENEVFTQTPATKLPLKAGDKIRVQMNVTVGTVNLSAGGQAFQLEYVAAEDCTTASGWASVGAIGGGTIWRFFDNTSLTDGATEVNQISTSDVAADYVESNPTQTNPNAVNTAQDMEWDFAVENNGAAENTTYCFRMAKSGGTALDTYNSDGYPKLTTAPGAGNLMRHGNFFQNALERAFFWAN